MHVLNVVARVLTIYGIIDVFVYTYQGCRKVFTTGEAKVHPEHQLTECVGGRYLTNAHNYGFPSLV